MWTLLTLLPYITVNHYSNILQSSAPIVINKSFYLESKINSSQPLFVVLSLTLK